MNQGLSKRRSTAKDQMGEQKTTCKKEESNQNDDDVTKEKDLAKRCALVSFKDLPEYMKDNEFILDHYRVDWPLKEALFSVLRWHNETLNVWTYVTTTIFQFN